MCITKYLLDIFHNIAVQCSVDYNVVMGEIKAVPLLYSAQVYHIGDANEKSKQCHYYTVHLNLPMSLNVHLFFQVIFTHYTMPSSGL